MVTAVYSLHLVAIKLRMKAEAERMVYPFCEPLFLGHLLHSGRGVGTETRDEVILPLAMYGIGGDQSAVGTR